LINLNNTPLQIYRAHLPISLLHLRDDLARVQSIFNFEQGPFSCSIPLAHSKLLHESFSEHYNNNPHADVIDKGEYPAFQAIYDLIPSPKASFRLIRRPPFSAYELHTDHDRGKNVCRLQVPIYSGQNAFLCLSDKKNIPEIRSVADLYTPEKFAKRFAINRIEALQEGWLYAFSVDYIHTLYNGESTDRITLIIDVVMDNCFNLWWKQNMIPIINPK